jgi:hypothetical protein
MVTSTMACQRDFGSQVKADTFVEGCFDRAADPDWSEPLEARAGLEKITAWRAQHQRAYDTWPDVKDAEITVGERTQQQLEALGYVQ